MTNYLQLRTFFTWYIRKSLIMGPNSPLKYTLLTCCSMSMCSAWISRAGGSSPKVRSRVGIQGVSRQ